MRLEQRVIEQFCTIGQLQRGSTRQDKAIYIRVLWVDCCFSEMQKLDNVAQYYGFKSLLVIWNCGTSCCPPASRLQEFACENFASSHAASHVCMP